MNEKLYERVKSAAQNAGSLWQRRIDAGDADVYREIAKGERIKEELLLLRDSKNRSLESTQSAHYLGTIYGSEKNPHRDSFIRFASVLTGADAGKLDRLYTDIVENGGYERMSGDQAKAVYDGARARGDARARMRVAVAGPLSSAMASCMADMAHREQLFEAAQEALGKDASPALIDAAEGLSWICMDQSWVEFAERLQALSGFDAPAPPESSGLSL